MCFPRFKDKRAVLFYNIHLHISMKQLFIYSICLGGLLGFVLVFRFYRIWIWLRANAERRYWKTVARLSNSALSSSTSVTYRSTRILHRLMIRLGYLSDSVVLVSAFPACSNILLIYFNRNEPDGVRKTTGLLALLNLAPLFLGGRVNALLFLTGICQAEFYSIHKVFGTIALLEGCIHAILASSYRGARLFNHPLIIAVSDVRLK